MRSSCTRAPTRTIRSTHAHFTRSSTASELGRSLGLAVHAGHGLTVRNVGPVAAIAAIEELNIGHSIVSRAIFVGLAQSIAEMREAMVAARSARALTSPIGKA